jgi:hypothetical protein
MRDHCNNGKDVLDRDHRKMLALTVSIRPNCVVRFLQKLFIWLKI